MNTDTPNREVMLQLASTHVIEYRLEINIDSELL
jgi:hypothetical protein